MVMPWNMKGAGIPFVVVAVSLCGTPPLPVKSPKLTYATYVGTGRNSVFRGLAVDQDAKLYVAGSGPGSFDNRSCGFLTKLNQTGTAALWTLCLPVTEIDDIALDASGAIYAIGSSTHLVGNVSSRDPSIAMKLTPDGQTIIYSTKIVGAFAQRIAVDSTGSAYIAGQANSTFQTTPGAYSATSSNNGFLEKLDPTGAVQYATFLDFVNPSVFPIDIAVDSLGQAWVAGVACPGGPANRLRLRPTQVAECRRTHTLGPARPAVLNPRLRCRRSRMPPSQSRSGTRII